MEEPKSEKNIRETKYEEYLYVSALAGTITKGNDIWLVDSGASRNIIGF